MSDPATEAASADPVDPAEPTAAPAEALADWPLDEEFLSEVLRRARAATLVTLDVFDTALTRLVDSPVDLFAVVERDLAARLGPLATGYAVLREDAERSARLRIPPGREDQGFDAILDEVVRLRPVLLPHRAALARIELDAEHRLSAATPDILELCRRLAAEGIPFAFVSDMYLPEAAIGSMLRRIGYAGWRFLLVSADTGLTKHSGRQWDVVRERHGPGAILHIGDDAHADLHTPASRGIDALPYLRARSARRTGARLDPAIIPFSLLRRDTVLRARAVLPTPDAPPPADAAWWRDAGRVLGGIVLSAFIRWLEARVRHHRIEALHFLARDGFLLHRAWEASGAAARTGIPGRYLHVSRRTLSLSRGVLASNPDRLDQALLSFLASSDGTLTVSAALSRIGAADDPELRAAAAAEFGDPSTRLAWPDGTGRLERLLSRHAGTIHRRLAGGHALLVRYLRHEGLAAERGRIGIVDLGWHAGMQRSLRAVLEAERGEPASLHGFYYGLWPGALPNLWDAGPAEAAFCGPFRAAGPERGLSEAVEMLEELHTAPHGTVRGYREQDGNVVPVHADSPVERDQYDRITAPFQDGALDTLRRLFTGEAVAGIALDDLSPAAALAALSCVTLSPDPAELRAFGNIRHAATFDHDRFAALIPAGEIPDAEDDRRAALGACGWRFGTLSAWVDRAPPEARAALRAWSSFMLGPSFDPRCKRRFD